MSSREAADRSLDSARGLPTEHSSRCQRRLCRFDVDRRPVGIFSVGGSILAPLFEGGRLRAQADAAAARRDQAAYLYRKSRSMPFAKSKTRLLQLSVRASRSRYCGSNAMRWHERWCRQPIAIVPDTRLASNSWMHSAGLLSADLFLLQASNDRLSATVSLFQALGGGWTASP